MSATVTEALEALLVRYEHELKSLQTEHFIERIQAGSLGRLWSLGPAFNSRSGALHV
jgi:hypothetical protein